MSAVFDKVGTSLDEFVAAFPPVEHQVGAVFLINGRPAGLELFDAPSTWRKLSPKLRPQPRALSRGCDLASQASGSQHPG